MHNQYVCDDLRAKGAVFVDELDEVPTGATVIFSAHGVSQAVRRNAIERKLKVFDATCPLVTKVHLEVARMRREAREIIMIGHKGHPEVEGTMGQSEGGMYLVETAEDVQTLTVNDPTRLAYVTQTTLSIDDAEKVIVALRARFPEIVGPRRDDICYATQNRQDAVKALAKSTELVLVIGSRNSSNSNRLREVAELNDTRAFLVDNAGQVDPGWLKGVQSVGLTAGASAPEILVQDVVQKLVQKHAGQVSQLQGTEENITFALPKELQ